MSLNFFSQNVDAWGAVEWFDRLAKAVREQDAAVVAGDLATMEICQNVAASSAMTLVRDYEQQVRAALRQQQLTRPAREEIIEECAAWHETEAKLKNISSSHSVAAFHRFSARELRALSTAHPRRESK